MHRLPRRNLSILSSLLLLILLVLSSALSIAPRSYAHFDHFSMYNGRGEQLGNFNAYEALDPDYARPEEPTRVMFSIQDQDGNDVSDVNTMIEVYSASSGQRVHAIPWSKQNSGDFEVKYVFPEIGSYQIVLSVADGPVNYNTVDPARSILSSNRDCNCDRAVYNVSISEGFGTVWNSTMLVSILAPLALMGIVLGLRFRNRMKKTESGDQPAKLSAEEFLKYAIMLAAIAGGVVHLTVYSMHASLRLEYSLFLISAGGVQIAYGLLYIMATIAGEPATALGREYAKRWHQKTLAINIFGLAGSSVLLGLYIYTVIFPPPLSPANMPDKIEFAGILAKALEAFLVFGIVYLIQLEKRKTEREITRT